MKTVSVFHTDNPSPAESGNEARDVKSGSGGFRGAEPIPNQTEEETSGADEPSECQAGLVGLAKAAAYPTDRKGQLKPLASGTRPETRAASMGLFARDK